MSRGSRPGERRGGRRAGVPNKATRDIKALAQQFSPKAIAGLAGLAGLIEGVAPAQSEQARVAAMKELLDRGHGRPPQAIIGDDNAPPVRTIISWAS
jgi:hypothetical protein